MFIGSYHIKLILYFVKTSIKIIKYSCNKVTMDLKRNACLAKVIIVFKQKRLETSFHNYSPYISIFSTMSTRISLIAISERPFLRIGFIDCSY